jgi:4-hydroxybenzoate polyprenyltransferase
MNMIVSERQVIENASSAISRNGNNPLVVDLDGTLIRTDLLFEAFFQLLASHPLKALAAVAALKGGKAALKAHLADESLIEVETLPLNEDVLAFLSAEKAKGRPLYLASAADKRYVEAFASHLGFFDGAFGSEASLNLTGSAKAERLCELFGEGGFDYIGDAPVDEAVWRKAAGVYIANASPRHLAAVQTWAPHAQSVGTRAHPWRDYLKSLRLHQWLKNILVFVPALAAHQFGWPLLASVIAFLSFSLCASSVYVLNDLLDLKSDRAHVRKRLRPFASGRVPLVRGIVMVPILLMTSLALALFLPSPFLVALAGYYTLTCAYSFLLKRKLLVDVVALACLYGARLVAGGAAASVVLSPWLTAFAIFLFLSLALVKRCSELVDSRAAGAGDPVGRAYRIGDLPLLQVMSVASGYVAVLVLALYVSSDDVRALYSHPDRLWLLCVLLLYWLSRVALLTHRGAMHDDPVIFAVTDRVSQVVALACGLVVLASI